MAEAFGRRSSTLHCSAAVLPYARHVVVVVVVAYGKYEVEQQPMTTFINLHLYIRSDICVYV